MQPYPAYHIQLMCRVSSLSQWFELQELIKMLRAPASGCGRAALCWADE